MQLGSGAAVPVVLVGSCSSNLIPSLGTSICLRCCHKIKKIAWKIGNLTIAIIIEDVERVKKQLSMKKAPGPDMVRMSFINI